MSARGRHLLVTGFGPFPGVPRNPSAALAQGLGGFLSRRGVHARVLVLRTAYDAIPAMLAPALADDPAAVLMIGVAARAKRVRVEVRARNRASRLSPDAAGRISGRLQLDPGGPAERRSRVAGQALALLVRRGITATRSIDAGRYLCNAAYYEALRAGCPVLFVHIPPTPRADRPRPGRLPRRRRPSDDLVLALTDVARLLRRLSRPG